MAVIRADPKLEQCKLNDNLPRYAGRAPRDNQQYLEIIDRMRDSGAECVIEGCTEIVLLVQQEHTDVVLFDTTAIHAQDAVELALA